MKSLKYEGMVKIKIFRSLRRLEAGLSGFELKRVHYGKFGLQIITNLPYYTQPNTPLLLLLNKTRRPSLPSPFLHFLFFTHTPFGHSSPIKLPHLICSSFLLLGFVKAETDLWLGEVSQRWRFPAVTHFPAT